jgi:hypothetical protein
VLIGEAVTVVGDPPLDALEEFADQADTGDLPLLVAAAKNDCRYLLTFNVRLLLPQPYDYRP